MVEILFKIPFVIHVVKAKGRLSWFRVTRYALLGNQISEPSWRQLERNANLKSFVQCLHKKQRENYKDNDYLYKLFVSFKASFINVEIQR